MKRSIFSLLCVALLASACTKMDPEDERTVRFYANTFAYNVMDTYYLWKDEVSSRMENWGSQEDPVKKVEAVRFEMDRWTTLYEDYTFFQNYTDGNEETLGMDFLLYYYDKDHTRLCVVVTYTYEDSPARLSGLKRGDVILSINGETLTKDNYVDVATPLLYDGSFTLGMKDGRTIQVRSRKMYENPVHTTATLDYGGKRFGYLHFTNFTQDSCQDLESAFKKFKEDGITDLVLDLRYNGGGYVLTSTTLASMIAPPHVVKEHAVFNKQIYNNNLARSFDDVTLFVTDTTYQSISGQKVTVHPLEVNPGIGHLWVIVSGESASASEGLICGLKPYMDVTVVGKKTSGKFTGGFLLPATTWFDSIEKASFDIEVGKQAIPTWGMYVILYRYADCNGVTLSMPDGITPDYEAEDNPDDGIPLGDPSESMLAATLSIATGGPVPASVKSVSGQVVPEPIYRPGFGLLIH